AWWAGNGARCPGSTWTAGWRSASRRTAGSAGLTSRTAAADCWRPSTRRWRAEAPARPGNPRAALGVESRWSMLQSLCTEVSMAQWWRGWLRPEGRAGYSLAAGALSLVVGLALHALALYLR